MRVTMRFGKKGFPLEVPEGCDPTVIRKKPMPVLENPEEAVRSAFSRPVGCGTLAEEARGRKNACILICDVTRPVPNRLILPAMVQGLLQAGLTPETITILVATGLHRPNEGEELREVVGSDWVLQNARVANHFARNDADHELIGTTSDGIEARIDRRFLEADFRIAVGLVEPHFMAGYSGGRKIIAPGIAHQTTIRTFHSAKVLEHCNTTNCVLLGNPLHEAQLEIVRMAGGSLAVNTVIDEERRLSFVNFGEVEKSHEEAVRFVRPYAEVPIGRRFKTVVTTSAGYPLDATYYQTVKGMIGALEILEPGGSLIVLSECSEGMGSADYIEAQKKLVRLGPEEFLKGLLPKRYADIDEWQSEMQVRATARGTVYLYTEGLCSQPDLTGVHVIPSPAETIRKCIELHKDPCIAVIPEGPYIIPLYRPN